VRFLRVTGSVFFIPAILSPIVVGITW